MSPVAICETESAGMRHEEINAAIIELYIRRHGCTGVLFSTLDHWHCISRIYSQRLGHNLQLKHIELESPLGTKDEVGKYQALIRTIFTQLAEIGIRSILFTNVHYAALPAVISTIEKFPGIAVSMVVHGQLDEHLLMSRYQRWLQRPLLLDELMTQSSSKIRFFTVSGHIGQELQYRGLEGLQFASLHHPYLWNQLIKL